MANSLDTLKSAIYDDVVAVVNLHTSSPHDHVIVEDDDEPESPPMVALNASTTDDPIGIHGSYVIEVQHNPLDVKYGDPRTLSVDVTIADTDGGRADEIRDGLLNAFTYDNRVRDPDDLVSGDPPIDTVRARDTSPLDRDMRVGSALVVDVDYARTFWHSDLANPPTEVTRVEQSFEDGQFTDGDVVLVTDEDGTSIEPA